MNTTTRFIFMIAFAGFAFSCNTQKSMEENTANTSASVDVKKIERKSADNLDSLNNIILRSLITKDKNLYVSYCFTEEQEKSVAEILEDKAKKKYFKREFGFSLHEEVAYFENIIKYIEKVKIDLKLVDKGLIESIDYNRANYSPIVLKEVIIPIIQEGIERDIVYVAIQIDGRWYFTSELSL